MPQLWNDLPVPCRPHKLMMLMSDTLASTQRDGAEQPSGLPVLMSHMYVPAGSTSRSWWCTVMAACCSCLEI